MSATAGLQALRNRFESGEPARTACWLTAAGVGFELPTSRRAGTVPPLVARRRQTSRLVS